MEGQGVLLAETGMAGGGAMAGSDKTLPEQRFWAPLAMGKTQGERREDGKFT